MTQKIYLAEAGVSRITATIVAISATAEGRPVVRLDRTILHPQGGGQKADRGRIGMSHVIHVGHNDSAVDHVVDNIGSLSVGDSVEVELDRPWRQVNAVMHSAGHLLAGIVERLYPMLRAASGHQWPGEGRVEFEGARSVEDVDVNVINMQLQQALAEGWKVSVDEPFGERKIRIGDLTAIPCGGTHVVSLNDIANTVVRSAKYKGRLRLGYEAQPAHY